MRLLAPLCLVLCAGLTAAAAEGDLHALPQAAGTGDGRSWEHAMAASGAGLSAAIAKLPPGATLRLGSGTYAGLTIAVQAAGEAGRPVTIAGVDTGGGPAVLVGDWSKQAPAKGANAITIQPGTQHLVVADLVIRNYQDAVVIRAGGVRDTRFSGLRMEDVRSGFDLAGGTDAAKPESWNERLVIERCAIVHYTKRGIRFRRGNRDAQVIDVLADGGGKDWAVELWQTSFAVEGDRQAEKDKRQPLPDRDIRFERCTGRHNYHDAGNGYWNADAFAVEGGASGIVYVDCTGSDNTDAGWDDKSPGTRLVRCTSLRNKRNYRFWADAVMEDCVSGETVKLGGNGDAAAVWVSRSLAATRCTFLAQPKVLSLANGDARASFTDCTFVAGADGGVLWPAEHQAQVTETGSTRQGAFDPPAVEPAAK